MGVATLTRFRLINAVPHLDHTIGNLKAWLTGTRKGVSRHHLGAYLDEFVFRQNRRLNLAAAFQTLPGLGTTRDATTYETITGAKDIPGVPYTLSRKRTGTRKRRKKFVPAAPTPAAANP
jgi:hypothetical protein